MSEDFAARWDETLRRWLDALEDKLAPFAYKGVTHSQNWDTAGQDLMANGCCRSPRLLAAGTGAEPSEVRAALFGQL